MKKKARKAKAENLTLNFFLVALLVTLLVFTSGQQGCKKEEKINTTALVMNFVESAPPFEVVSGTDYPIYVDAKNVGGADIDAGLANFYLGGIGENLKDVNTKVRNTVFLAKKTAMQEGGKERLIFATAAQPITLPAPFDFTIKLDSCYRYATTMQTSICVGKEGVCSVAGEKIKTTSNSIAPIQITSIKEEIKGNKLYVIALIENKGSGTVYLPTADCDKLQAGNIDERLKKDQFEIDIRAERGFSCNLKSASYENINALMGITSLGLLTCEKTLTEETHAAPFEIVLVYKYKEAITKAIKILPA